MARKTKSSLPREVTKRRLARWQQERRRRRITVGIGALVIVAIMVIIGYGFYTTRFAPAREWVTKVGGNDSYTVFTRSDYADALQICELGLYPPSGDDREAPLFVLESNELIRQGAAEAVLPSVTETELTQQIKDFLFPEQEEIDWDAYEQFLSSTQLSRSRFEDIMGVQVLLEKLDQHLRDQLPEVGDVIPHVHLQAITVTTEEEAGNVTDRLEGGEDFASLAVEYGDGDMGWVPKGIMSPEYENIAFSLEIGNVSEPLQTAEGFSIIQVLEKADRALDEATRGGMEDAVFDRWLAAQREERVERNPDLDDPEKLEELYQWSKDQKGLMEV